MTRNGVSMNRFFPVVLVLATFSARGFAEVQVCGKVIGFQTNRKTNPPRPVTIAKVDTDERPLGSGDETLYYFGIFQPDDLSVLTAAFSAQFRVCFTDPLNVVGAGISGSLEKPAFYMDIVVQGPTKK